MSLGSSHRKFLRPPSACVRFEPIPHCCRLIADSSRCSWGTDLVQEGGQPGLLRKGSRSCVEPRDDVAEGIEGQISENSALVVQEPPVAEVVAPSQAVEQLVPDKCLNNPSDFLTVALVGEDASPGRDPLQCGHERHVPVDTQRRIARDCMHMMLPCLTTVDASHLFVKDTSPPCFSDRSATFLAPPATLRREFGG